jgi:nucleoside-diphosphate-sugar epimerase
MLSKRSIAIVGYGWLGKSLSNYLIRQGLQVNSGSRSLSDVQRHEGLTLFPFKFQENQLIVSNSFWKVQALVVCIPPGREGESYPELISNLLEKASLHQIETILFTSSTSVYQDIEGEVTEESKSLNQGIILLSEDCVIQSGLPRYYCLRLGGLIGNGRHPGNFMSGKTGIPKPAAVVNLIQQEELIDIISQLIGSEIESGIFNVCSMEHPMRRDYYIELSKKAGKELPMFDESDLVKGKVISSEKIRRLLPNIQTKSIYDFP